ncbi:pentatricopeptide repeat-containing protein ELI1, chloroplastic-like [Selaginella moellendorffii]|uniref:pentatricopeptide repeat-containing protein ELI1, chloroplastic-like n=1 Tax=Selaginella moellendorffii TaxID=88036 RepID=UPI000D1C62C4|nr:pentatricopeptide repeat-containing protein ELI1, chloroplastic-like [Selaginella moellendorffii]|eukprot:XP_024516741.1 pentatricopeptide repeat-containing protein ELI1, chloroplastic-like [Selaginella moellendorffii]
MAYAQNRLEEAKEIYDQSPQRTMVTYNTMVTAYSQNGHLQCVKALFDGMEQQDIVSWNAMLAPYAQSRHDTQTVDLFESMDIDGVTPNHVSLISALDACSMVGELRLADTLYDAALTLGCMGDYKVCMALVNAYGWCGSLGNAKWIFDPLRVMRLQPGILYLVGKNLSDAKSLVFFHARAQSHLLEHHDGRIWAKWIPLPSPGLLLANGSQWNLPGQRHFCESVGFVLHIGRGQDHTCLHRGEWLCNPW